MRPRAIITATTHPMLKAGLEARGYTVDVQEQISYAALSAIIGDYQGMIVSTRLNIDAALLSGAKSLQWIGRLGSGMEIIDVDYATANRIHCISSPEGNCGPVGEHCLGLLLSLMHHITRAAVEVAAGKWIREQNRGIELRGKTVGIIGYGHTGSSFGALLAPFGVRVLAVDKHKKNFASGHVEEASLEQVMRAADVISFHLPLDAATMHYANDHFFEGLVKKPFLLNASRGGVVDQQALIRALDAGKIAGVALDVLENEELTTYSQEEKAIFNNLIARKNVLITPHIAGYSRESLYRMPEVILQKLDLLLQRDL
jgi:D-3-phosphoglycerate dehydrogenase / 2-oxoglutarate reductase